MSTTCPCSRTGWRRPSGPRPGSARRSSRPATTSSTAVERAALLLAVTTALVPIFIVGLYWLVQRLRFIRRAGAAQRFIDAAPDLDLFALRAMANQPMPRLAGVSDDPAGALAPGRRPRSSTPWPLLELAEVRRSAPA